MTFGPKRCHVVYIFENFIKDFGLLIGAIAIGLFIGNMQVVMENAGVLVIVLLGPVGRLVQFFCTTYEVDEEKLLIRKGLLTKKVIEIPLSTITTVDFTQNVFHQICKAYRLNVDNASNMSSQETKATMTFGEKDAFLLRDLLIKGRKGLDGFNLGEVDSAERKEGAVYRVESSQLLCMGALKSKGVFFAQVFAFVMGANALFNISSERLGQSVAEAAKTLGAGYLLIAVIIVCFLLAIFAGMIGCLLRYYGFTVTDNGEAIKIEYGLFTRKRYTIQKNRISGFSYEQSLFMRMFRTGTLKLFAIGYGSAGGDESSEEPILFPLIKENEVKETVSKIVPEMGTENSYIQAKKGSLRYFFYGMGFITALLIMAASLYLSIVVPYCMGLWMIGLLCVIYSVWGRILEYRHGALHTDHSHFSMVWGGFKTHTLFVKSTHIESVSSKSTRLKARKQIGHVEFYFIAPTGSNHCVVSNLDFAAYDEAKTKLVY